MNEEEEFFAWLDGELEGEAAERVAARVAASPELTRRAEQHRRLASNLRQAFQPVVAAESNPPTFGAADVTNFGVKANARAGWRRWLAAPQLAAMAASLVIGLAVGMLVSGSGNNSPVAVEGNRLVAAAALDHALDSSLASAPAAEGPRVVLSFRDASGRICRSFTDAEASGLACREGDDWRLRGLFQGADGQSGEYRMAAGEDPRLAALIDETISGEPFDAAQEKAALDAGWR